MSKLKGLAAIVEEERPTEAPPASEPVQLVLAPALGVALAGSAGPIVAAPDDAGEPGELVQGERRVGRPPGARNKSTEAWRRFIVGQYGSPLQALARIYSADPRELAAYLGCKPVEALAQMAQAARVALPYLHSEMPKELKVDSRGALAFAVMMDRPGRGDVHMDETDPLAALQRFSEMVENQEVMEGEASESNTGESNDPRIVEADQ